MKNHNKKIWAKIRLSFWLLWSSTGVILFSFGMLALFNSQGTKIPVIIGASMIILAIFLGKFTTETSTAQQLRKK